MRNLKRVLSLALALVMMLGMMIITTSAAEAKAGFADAGDIEYAEAADVLNAIGVIEGVGEGSNRTFNPDGILTREQAAAIISRMLLGEANADKLGNNTQIFKDVAAGRWSAGNISYCANLGIIAGDGSGSFDPEGKLTGVAFAKMLLVALGYDAQIEGYVDNANWSTNIAVDAMDAGIDVDGVKMSDPLTREQAAQMALSTIKAPLVEYDTKGSNISVNGADISFGASQAKPVTTTVAQYQTISKVQLTNSREYTIEFGEKYFPRLKLDPTTDVFGRPAHIWTNSTTEIGTYVDSEKLIASYTAGVTGKTLYELLGRTVVDQYSFEIYIDGETEKDILGNVYFDEGNLVRTNTKSVGGTGNGVLTEVYVDHAAGEVTIAIINTYLAKASADYSAKRDNLSLTVYKINDAGDDQFVKTATQTENLTVNGADFDIEDYKQDDIVLVTVAEGAIQSMEAPEVISSTAVDSFKKSAYLTVNDTKYNFASTLQYDSELIDYTDGTATVNLKDATYDVYLDEYGYVIGIKEINAKVNYLFMTGYDGNYSNLSSKTADVGVIFTDGTMETVKVNVKKSDDSLFEDGSGNPLGNTDKDKAAATVNKWCTYTVDNNGVYTLKEVDTYQAGKVGQYADTDYATTIDRKRVSLLADTNKYCYGNDKSIYIVAETDEINVGDGKTAVIISDVDAVMTGIKNVSLLPTAADATSSTKIGTSGGVYTLFDRNAYVIAAVVVGENESTSSNYAYVTSSNVNYERYNSADREYTWTRDVVIGGEVVELVYKNDSALNVISATNMEQGEWYRVNYYADGTVKSIDDAKSTGGTTYQDNTAIDFDAQTDDRFADTVAKLSSESILVNFDNAFLNDITNTKLTCIGATLYTDVAQTEGFAVASDVKVILGLKVDGTQFKKTEEYSGITGLETAIKDMDATGSWTGGKVELNAVFENGIAVVVIINDTTGTTTDEGSSTHNANFVKVNLGTDGTVTLQDKSGATVTSDSSTYDYVLYLRGASQETFNVAADGTLAFASGVYSQLTLTSGNSYYVIVDGVKSNTVTA